MKVQHPVVSVQGLPAEIAAEVEAQIRRRLGGQVSDLRVVVRGDGRPCRAVRPHPARQTARSAHGHGGHRTADRGQRDPGLTIAAILRG